MNRRVWDSMKTINFTSRAVDLKLGHPEPRDRSHSLTKSSRVDTGEWEAESSVIQLGNQWLRQSEINGTEKVGKF